MTGHDSSRVWVILQTVIRTDQRAGTAFPAVPSLESTTMLTHQCSVLRSFAVYLQLHTQVIRSQFVLGLHSSRADSVGLVVPDGWLRHCAQRRQTRHGGWDTVFPGSSSRSTALRGNDIPGIRRRARAREIAASETHLQNPAPVGFRPSRLKPCLRVILRGS